MNSMSFSEKHVFPEKLQSAFLLRLIPLVLLSLGKAPQNSPVNQVLLSSLLLTKNLKTEAPAACKI